MGIAALLAIAAAVAGSVFLLRGRPAAPAIVRPTLGILNLDPQRFGAIANEDAVALGSLFARMVEAEREPPACDVLLLYCAIGPRGEIEGSVPGLGEIIRRAGAKVVIMASENDSERYMQAAQGSDTASVNLVMTLERKGDGFPSYFVRLFRLMFEGTSMPVAWVTLSPQAPGIVHEGPELVMSCGFGQLAFRAS
jgi:hypothetical protein